MTLKEWITKEGPQNLAKKLKLNVSCIQYWRLGKRCPRPKQMQRIRELSKGAVTYEEIIDTYLLNRR